MRSPRWQKLRGDLGTERGRVILMVLAIAVSVAAVGSVLGAYSILSREIAVNYLGTRPASASLDLPDGVDRDIVAAVRRDPAVAEAEMREVVVARAHVGDDWRPLLLFVIDDFNDLRLNTFRPERGAWPPPDGTMLIERSARPVLGIEMGGRVTVKTPHGAPREVLVSGIVHDPGLAPAWQEQEGYGYVTRATLSLLGETPVLHELRIAARSRTRDPRAIEALAATVARDLAAQGHPVHSIRVPPPGQHPHQRQMTTILLLMLTFSAMALVLSAILVATTLSSMLARQVREIGVMKTLGARSSQLAGLYAVLVAGLGAVAVCAAMPVGVAGARQFAGAVSTMLNFTLTSTAIPWWVFAIEAAAGVLVPLLVATVPIARAARITARQAMDQHGVSAEMLHPAISALPAPLRNVVRRPARLALTVGLLAAGGAMFMTALNVSRGWQRNIDKVYETRNYDVEVRFSSPQPLRVADALRAIPGVRLVESWGYTPAAIARRGQIDVLHTYPDRSHGSLVALAPPPETTLVHFPVLAGRWLERGDTDGVVLTHGAVAQAPQVRVGSAITLSFDGEPSTWRVVGIVEEIGSPGAAYVTDEAFARVAGTGGAARMIRVVTDATTVGARANVIRAIETDLLRQGVDVESVTPLSVLRTAMGDHVAILVQALIAMAIIMAIVGVLGLASTMGTSVVERSREIGVLKAIGATRRNVIAMFVTEALSIGALSWTVAFAFSLPLTWMVDRLVGNLGFLAPLPFVITPGAAAAWFALVAIVAMVATVLPARRAARLTVREALA